MKTKLRQYEPLFVTFFRISDGLIGILLIWGIYFFFQKHFEHQLEASVVIFFVIFSIFSYSSIYQSWRMGSIYAEFGKIIQGCLAIYFTLFTLIYFLEISHLFPRRVILSWTLVWPVVLLIQRVGIRKLLRYYRKKGGNIKNAVIVGSGRLGARLTEWINENPWSGTHILGFFNDRSSEKIKGLSLLGSLNDLPDYVYNNNVDIIYIALQMEEKEKFKWIINELSNSTITIYMLPDIPYFDFIQTSNVMYVGNIPVFSLVDTPFHGINYILKKVEDIVLGTLFLLLVSPVMLVIAAAIKLTSPGPILFKQWRHGLNGKSTLIWKFRTMKECDDGYYFHQATRRDPRVTKLGAFLRKTSLDELPQFINVIQGKMSIVGPRPNPVAMNDRYRNKLKGYMLRHKLKPGITGLAQINGCRGETDTYEKIKKRLKFDLLYSNNWSLFLDIKIIFLTVIKMIKDENAY